ncbi:hypothetical protein ACWDXD_23260 [Streptomyces sp. NPDC003314]
MHVADIERLIGHRARNGLRRVLIRFGPTVHDAGHELTAADVDLAHRIDAVTAAHWAGLPTTDRPRTRQDRPLPLRGAGARRPCDHVRPGPPRPSHCSPRLRGRHLSRLRPRHE